MWGAILGVASTALSLFAQKKQSDAQERAADYNVSVAREEAEYQQWKGDVESHRLMDLKNRLVARQRVMFAKAGVTLDSGTTEAVFRDTIKQYKEDASILKQQTALNVRRAQAGAKMAEEEGESAKMAGYLSMGRTLLNSASSIYNSWGS